MKPSPLDRQAELSGVAARRSAKRYVLPTVLALTSIAAGLLYVDPLLAHSVDDLGPTTRAVFRSLTKWGESDWIFWLCAATLAALYLLLQRRPPRRLASGAKLLVDATWFVVLAIAGSGLLVQAIKQVVGRARPKFLDTLGPYDFTPFLFDADHASFPSGHSATAFALATVVALFSRRWLVPAYALALLVGFSRIVTHSHYFSDVAAGALLGLSFTLAVQHLAARNRWLFERDRQGSFQLRGRRVLRQLPRQLVAFLRPARQPGAAAPQPTSRR